MNWSSFASRTDVPEHRLKPVAGNAARDWLQMGPLAASEVLLAFAVLLGQSASGAAMPTFTFDDLLLWSEIPSDSEANQQLTNSDQVRQNPQPSGKNMARKVQVVGA
jgi:hypothetical protein